MSTSQLTSTSIEVKAANSKLAIFLRRKEEEEALLQIGKRKPKGSEEKARRLPGGKEKWTRRPDFHSPSPLIDRPRTESGATSFHFSVTSISKEGHPTLNGKPINGFSKPSRNPAVDHSKYIERDGAAERSLGAEHSGYIERPEAVESFDPSAIAAEEIERRISDLVNETELPDSPLKLGKPVDIEGIPSIFSNISDDPFEREEFWRAVERTEREPKVHSIILNPEDSPRWWSNLANAPDVDPAFRNFALQVAERYKQHLALHADKPEPAPHFDPPPFRVSSDRAGDILTALSMIPGWNQSNPPAEFQSGRGGRVQMRFVTELPHELSPEDRALLVQNFVKHLGSFTTDKDGNPTGLMYTAVIHAPDAHNDSRNYHLHVIAHDRPATWLPQFQKWDFEVAEQYDHKGEVRVRYPLRQNKIGEVSRKSKDADETTNAISGMDFIPSLRREYARITNQILAARRIDRVYDHRKYTEMGIDRTPTEHLGTRAAALEAIGVSTPVGKLNAIKMWSDSERAIYRKAQQVDKALREFQGKLRGIQTRAMQTNVRTTDLTRIRELAAERETLIKTVAEERMEILTFDHMEAKAKSRALVTQRTAMQYLKEIEEGQITTGVAALRKVINERWQEAAAHLQQIDDALAPHREPLKKAADDIRNREERIKEIDAALAPHLKTLEEDIEAARPKWRGRPAKDAADKAVQPGGNLDSQPEETPANISTISSTGMSMSPPTLSPDKRFKEKVNMPFDEKLLDYEVDPDHLPTEKLQAASETPEPAASPDAPELTSHIESLAPPSIGGKPIITPTIEAASPISEEPRGGTMEGLEPLAAPTMPSGDETSVRVSLDDPENSDRTAALPQSSGPATSPETEPKIDRRRRQKDPTLFELEEQSAPIKPGSAKATHAEWNSLINEIEANRMPVFQRSEGTGYIYTVPSLSDERANLLSDPRFAKRSQGRLEAIFKIQQLEIEKIIRWIRKDGREAQNLQFEGRSAQVVKASKSIKTLLAHWGQAPIIKSAFEAENNRRILIEARTAEKPRLEAGHPSRPLSVAETIEARKRIAEQIYPRPEEAHTQEVRNLIHALLEGKTGADIKPLVDAIRQNSIAIQDVHFHTAELAMLYDQMAQEEGPKTTEPVRETGKEKDDRNRII